MDYKKIIKNRQTRTKILNLLSFVPDSAMLKFQYKIKTGRRLNLKEPKRFTEKLQWYKLNYKDPLMIQCVDKYDVREYISSLGFGNILNECYGVFDRVEDVDFDKFPNQFVLKDTLGGGGNSIIICKDKRIADLDQYRNIMREWVDTKLVRSGGREWPYYSGKKHRIICDRYLEAEDGDLFDYKFFCYHGEPQYVVLDAERYIEHKRNFYDMEWNNLRIASDCLSCDKEYPKPGNFDEMISIAQFLSKKFPYVRVDLFNLKDHVYFSELTFYPWSGYVNYDPDEFDYELGKNFEISE